MPTLDATEAFGRAIGKLLQDSPMPVLLSGPLGAGKTSLARSIVSALPGSENAEFSSPSFNICNYYPTSPEIAHCDLYRCRSAIPEEVENAIFNKEIITLVEWAHYLPDSHKPPFFLDISLAVRNNARFATLVGKGEKAASIMAELLCHKGK